MSKPHQYIVNPEFNDLQKFVWEGLNQIGRPISQIKTDGKKGMLGDYTNQELKEKPIWHNKSNLDEFVARSLGLNLDDYGKDKGKNKLYKAIANEVGRLRRKGIIIDWRRIPAKDTGMGVWRLDKTELNAFVYKHTKKEIKNNNYHCSGSPSMIFVRQKQNAFRSALLCEYNKCVFCGFRLEEYLIGAHIVPYFEMRRKDADNSMNPVNGLLLCKLCDVAFELGSITVEEDLGIVISEYLQEQNNPAIKSWIDFIHPEIHLKKNAKYPPDPRYLKWKRKLLVNSNNELLKDSIINSK